MEERIRKLIDIPKPSVALTVQFYCLISDVIPALEFVEQHPNERDATYERIDLKVSEVEKVAFKESKYYRNRIKSALEDLKEHAMNRQKSER